MLLIIAAAGWMLMFGWISTVESNDDQLAITTSERLEQTSRVRWLIDTNDLGQYLLQTYPQYESVDINQSLFSRTLQINATLSTAQLQWRSAGRTLTLSERGVALEQIEEPLEQLPLINDRTNLNYQPGDRVSSPELISFLEELSRAEGEQFNYESVTLSNSRVVTVKPADYQFQIILSTDIDPIAQLKSVETLIEQGSIPSRYADTSIAGRIFWQ